MATAPHPLQNAPIDESVMTAFFMAFLCLALGSDALAEKGRKSGLHDAQIVRGLVDSLLTA